MKTYDLIVIGSGSGGLTSAYTGLGFGKKVLIVDKELPGGECTWSGCIPSKALINEAKKVYSAKKLVGDFEYDTTKAMNRVKDVIAKVYEGESVDKLGEDGIEFLQGYARFVSPKEILVNGQTYSAKKYIISTGSSPFIPPIRGIKDVPILDNASLFKLNKLPDSVIILGAGAIGTEMAQAMNRLGVEVHLVEMSDRILAREEAEFSQRLEYILADEGVLIHTSTKAHSIENSEDGVVLSVEKAGKKASIFAKALLVATGRQPNVEGLGLEEAGVDYDDKKIHVNAYMQTSQKHIYAVGDVVGSYQFSHAANVEGIQAVQNSLSPIKRKVKDEHMAWVTFTQPEFARAGLLESEAREKYGESIRVYTFDFDHLDRAVTKGRFLDLDTASDINEGVKIILSAKGKVLGASILADRAGEMIGEIQVIKTLNHNFSKLSKVIHPYPTYSEVFNKIGKKVAIDNILGHPLVKLFRK